ncbi:calcium-binding mitochondrial carrier protein SCaMC-1-like [Alosa sapidissima]|uniref:calcium-binding mitochondrial carrier protein SCaMC-1-like n=1 Tax=Alosa sapidissima TaxID=34773 RepID=UPI001C09B45B|nr:calcium-binding mitochondrial carrier protein SCaMC-1-like [Alosa sapidissima]
MTAKIGFPPLWSRARCLDSGVDPEREQRWAELFDELDLNKDGRIDVSELRAGLAARGLLSRGSVEEKIVRAGDRNADGQLDFEEFCQYLHSHERRLRLMFRSLDRNNDASMKGRSAALHVRPVPHHRDGGGPMGLYRGIAPNFLKVIPASASPTWSTRT